MSEPVETEVVVGEPEEFVRLGADPCALIEGASGFDDGEPRAVTSSQALDGGDEGNCCVVVIENLGGVSVEVLGEDVVVAQSPWVEGSWK
ncbi:hypothetical protein G6O69_36125 [Pseudenhygromyxa sp. WMMC2535]|uniref:hypothetical protein n=1 Tax=Pseudenhygromyxa sp. WMMC2535 TaxID=2712867 RepID=UPI0015569726|nr:hypothetical protein [Pseudenhygromyxa sp. WMMC2535]NVB43309.1 hypothetical protein [Pseudenhygromyxa sp. WMMC2535]